MASAAGLEPTTHSLGNCCSILMSYADVRSFYKRLDKKEQEFFLDNLQKIIKLSLKEIFIKLCYEKVYFYASRVGGGFRRSLR